MNLKIVSDFFLCFQFLSKVPDFYANGRMGICIHSTSRHKDLAWKLIMLMQEPNILAPWLVEQGFLPTQVAIGEGESRS